jgi:hypothetical protein
MLYFIDRIANGFTQMDGLIIFNFKQMKCHTLSSFLPNPGQKLQRIGQLV